MTRPNRFVLRMVVFVLAVAAVAGTLAPTLIHIFLANPGLNGLIVGIFVTGIVMNFRQVLLLNPEVEWMEGWRRGTPILSGARLRLLAPMAGMLGERSGRMNLSAMALRSLLDSIAARLDEGRDLARYFVGLLIFLGLLGTFWGLAQTIASVGDVIGSLTVSGPDMAAAFDRLKVGLAAPLSGMGTAFSTSLFGLSGSLIVGFLDLQAGQAQNAFYNELEDWLASQTRLSGGGGDGEHPVPAYIQSLLEQTADSLAELQRILARGEESRIATNANIRTLIDKMSILDDHLRTEQALLARTIAAVEE